MNRYLDSKRDETGLTISLKEDWTFNHARVLQRVLADIDGESEQQVTFQCGGLQNIDIAGAWVLFRKSQQFEREGRKTQFLGFKAAHFKFLENITRIRDSAVVNHADVPESPTGRRVTHAIEGLGKKFITPIEDVGRIAHSILSGVTHPSRMALTETIRQIEHTGARAVPIVALVSFLMGLVLAYQGAIQLAEFGAEVFVANLVTVSMLREMGVLLAAIMAAGRSGSAFATSIGVMKLNEEIDALRVMGLNPNHVLVGPRVVGLLISLPLLAILGMIAGILGGLTLSMTVLDMSAVQYFERTADSASIQDFLVGIVKAPVFALIIGGVGTLRGMQVSGSAEQLGRLTTTAVVQSVFLIVLADAVFTVIFSRLGI